MKTIGSILNVTGMVISGLLMIDLGYGHNTKEYWVILVCCLLAYAGGSFYAIGDE